MRWFVLLNPQARENITAVSLLLQPYEEDCLTAGVEASYTELAVYMRNCMPGLEVLYLDVSDKEIYRAASAFFLLFERKGMKIEVRRRFQASEVEEFYCKEVFMKSFEAPDVALI
jgi:hypothetical protein